MWREIQGIEYAYRFKKGMRRGWKRAEGLKRGGRGEMGRKGVKGDDKGEGIKREIIKWDKINYIFSYSRKHKPIFLQNLKVFQHT